MEPTVAKPPSTCSRKRSRRSERERVSSACRASAASSGAFSGGSRSKSSSFLLGLAGGAGGGVPCAESLRASCSVTGGRGEATARARTGSAAIEIRSANGAAFICPTLPRLRRTVSWGFLEGEITRHLHPIFDLDEEQLRPFHPEEIEA